MAKVTFAAEQTHCSLGCVIREDNGAMAENRFHTREAAAALLKMAKTTSDPTIAARLVEAAADLKDQAGERPLASSVRPPDIVMEE